MGQGAENKWLVSEWDSYNNMHTHTHRVRGGGDYSGNIMEEGAEKIWEPEDGEEYLWSSVCKLWQPLNSWIHNNYGYLHKLGTRSRQSKFHHGQKRASGGSPLLAEESLSIDGCWESFLFRDGNMDSFSIAIPLSCKEVKLSFCKARKSQTSPVQINR